MLIDYFTENSMGVLYALINSFSGPSCLRAKVFLLPLEESLIVVFTLLEIGVFESGVWRRNIPKYTTIPTSVRMPIKIDWFLRFLIPLLRLF